ncbi:hypothetical protein ABZX98_21800 [Streptomyces sp. NPDC002992]|uniref:hypothetical protein n=1 Tax=Streptomyces sp. NPDC002992 TaxID=3154273 RepID=UPI0033B5EFDF
MVHEARPAGQLWVEDERGRRRMPDPVRTAAVRAVLLTSVTLIQATMAFFFAVTNSWLAFPLLLTSVGSTVVATWSVLDVWVTRQVWRQRNGVVSEPSSTARQLRRERRRARKAAQVPGRDPAPGAAGIRQGAEAARNEEQRQDEQPARDERPARGEQPTRAEAPKRTKAHALSDAA